MGKVEEEEGWRGGERSEKKSGERLKGRGRVARGWCER